MMHFAIVEDLAMDQEHLIRLIQENFKKHNETADFDCYESGEDFLKHSPRPLPCGFYGYYAGSERFKWH